MNAKNAENAENAKNQRMLKLKTRKKCDEWKECKK